MPGDLLGGEREHLVVEVGELDERRLRRQVRHRLRVAASRSPQHRTLTGLYSPSGRGGADAADLYARATGTKVNEAAIDFFRLTWDLKDLAEYLKVFRSPHQENDDTVRQCQALRNCAAIRHTWTALLA